MTVTAELTPTGRIEVVSDQPFRDIERMKQIPGGSVTKSGWFARRTWPTCMALRGVFGHDLTIGPQLNDWAAEEIEQRIKPAIMLRDQWDAEGDQDLYPFQRAGVQFLATAKRALLLDEMGTGKTPQTIRTLVEIARRGGNPFPAIVVAPNNMVLTWKAELARFWPGIKVGVVKGTIAERRKVLMSRDYHIWIINFEGMKSHSRLAGYGSIQLKKCGDCDKNAPDSVKPQQCEVHKRELNEIAWKTIVVDEVHRIKDPKAKQTRAVWALRSPSVEYVYGLTGTPIGDTPLDLWTALHLIDPDGFPSRSAYQDRYCQTMYDIHGGAHVIGLRQDTSDEFFKVVEPLFRRMPKEAVLPFLPPKVYNRRYIEMTAKQAKAYRQMEENMVAMTDGAPLVAANGLTKLTRLIQFSSAYAELDEDGETVKLIGPSNKIEALLEILEDTGDEQAVVFAQSRQLIEMAAEVLEKKGISYGLIVGGQEVWERQGAMNLFQAKQTRVMLCTISAGGTGITLNSANRAIFLQRSWSMIENKQAEDRVHRIGSEVYDRVELIDLISVGTVEEAQHIAIAGKEERLQEVVRDKSVIARLKEVTEWQQ